MCQSGTSDVPQSVASELQTSKQTFCKGDKRSAPQPGSRRGKERHGRRPSSAPCVAVRATARAALLRQRSAARSRSLRRTRAPGFIGSLRRRSPDCPCSAAGILAAPPGLVTVAPRSGSPPAICTKHPVLCSRRGRLCGAQRPQNKYFVQFALQPGAPGASVGGLLASLAPAAGRSPDCPLMRSHRRP